MKEFLRANKIADEHTIKLAYSGLRLGGLTSTFCGACGSNFSLTPHGDVTSCFEVTEKEDPRSAIFFYGTWKNEEKEFEFRQENLDFLKSFNVQNISYCGDCIAKWHCAGDCLAKVAHDSDVSGDRGSPRCRLNQDITQKRIIQLFADPPKDKTAVKTDQPVVC